MPGAVTASCPPIIFSVTQFVHGACAGLDSDQVRQAAYNAGIDPIALFFYSLGWKYELLVATACITALGGWTRQLSMYTLAWLAVWPLLALGTALLALHRADFAAQHGLRLNPAASLSRGGPGTVGTFVRILIVCTV